MEEMGNTLQGGDVEDKEIGFSSGGEEEGDGGSEDDGGPLSGLPRTVYPAGSRSAVVATLRSRPRQPLVAQASDAMASAGPCAYGRLCTVPHACGHICGKCGATYHSSCALQHDNCDSGCPRPTCKQQPMATTAAEATGYSQLRSSFIPALSGAVRDIGDIRAAKEGDESTDTLKHGDAVTVVGFTSMAPLNGRTGKVVGYQTASGRVQDKVEARDGDGRCLVLVQLQLLDGEEGTMAFETENLKKATVPISGFAPLQSCGKLQQTPPAAGRVQVAARAELCFEQSAGAGGAEGTEARKPVLLSSSERTNFRFGEQTSGDAGRCSGLHTCVRHIHENIRCDIDTHVHDAIQIKMQMHTQM